MGSWLQVLPFLHIRRVSRPKSWGFAAWEGQASGARIATLLGIVTGARCPTFPHFPGPERAGSAVGAGRAWGEWPAVAERSGLGQMALLMACASGGQGLGVWACTPSAYQAASSTVNPQQTMEDMNVPEKEVLARGESIASSGKCLCSGWLDLEEGR